MHSTYVSPIVLIFVLRLILRLLRYVRMHITNSSYSPGFTYLNFYFILQEPGKLSVEQQVLLNDPTKGKLDPRWTGPWLVEEIKEPSTVKIRMGNSTRVVHINRIRALLQGKVDDTPVDRAWNPPYFHHSDGSNSGQDSDTHESSGNADARSRVVTRSGRTVRPPDYYGH